LIVTFAPDRFAVQVVLDNVCGGHDSGRDITGDATSEAQPAIAAERKRKQNGAQAAPATIPARGPKIPADIQAVFTPPEGA
jgi:hypothetical protein